MLYMLTIHYDPSRPFEGNLQPEHHKLELQLREQGKFVSGAGLMPVEATGHVTVRDGQVLKTDGPFTETKELLGGYYIVDVPTEDEASAIAARIPIEKRSWVEVRQIALFHPNIEVIAAMAEAR